MKTVFFYILFLITYIISIACDQDLPSFFNTIPYGDIVIKAKVIDKKTLTKLPYHQEETVSIKVLIQKRMYGYDYREIIEIISYPYNWSNTCTYSRINNMVLNHEYLIMLEHKNGKYRLERSTKEAYLEIQDDSLSMGKHFISLSEYEQSLQNTYGTFSERNTYLISYTDQQYMKPIFISALQGEMLLKDSLPNGYYFVYKETEYGISIVEEAHYVNQHKVGRHHRWQSQGFPILKSCYTSQGQLQGTFKTYYNDHLHHIKNIFFYKNGKLQGKQYNYWNNGHLKKKSNHPKNSDTSYITKRNIRNQLEFEGYILHNKQIGKHYIYNQKGFLSQLFYTNEKGKQGICFFFNDKKQLIGTSVFLDNLPHGKTVAFYSSKKIDPFTLDLSKNIDQLGVKHTILYDFNYAYGKLEGKQIQYRGKNTEIHYYKKGEYISCENCTEF